MRNAVGRKDGGPVPRRVRLSFALLSREDHVRICEGVRGEILPRSSTNPTAPETSPSGRPLAAIPQYHLR